MGLWKVRDSSEITTFIYSRSNKPATNNQQEKVTGAPVVVFVAGTDNSRVRAHPTLPF